MSAMSRGHGELRPHPSSSASSLPLCFKGFVFPDPGSFLICAYLRKSAASFAFPITGLPDQPDHPIFPGLCHVIVLSSSTSSGHSGQLCFQHTIPSQSIHRMQVEQKVSAFVFKFKLSAAAIFRAQFRASLRSPERPPAPG